MLIAVVVLLVVAVVWLWFQRRRTSRLRQGFGPEYDRTVDQAGSRRQAESDLESRRRRVGQLHIRPLTPDERTRFSDAWRETQARFVDDPDAAIGEADRLITEVMRVRGYPVGEFEQRAADISVDHPRVVENYRAAHTIAGAQGQGEVSTEDLRQAMVHYRALFDEVLETDQVQEPVTRDRDDGLAEHTEVRS
ncbi:MAG: hypothetical protein ACRDJ9_12905 [Dehalococcoidia bacterium]